jgi:glycosyltransferase involved in cell wall biosynthesis
LKSCNVFLLPSFFEGMPMSLLESMAFGLVPITTAVGSIPAVVSDGTTGILLNEPDPSEVVAAIRSLAADRERMERLSRDARSHICQHFQASVYCARLNEIYQYE